MRVASIRGWTGRSRRAGSDPPQGRAPHRRRRHIEGLRLRQTRHAVDLINCKMVLSSYVAVQHKRENAMTTTVLNNTSLPDLRAIVDAVAPKHFMRDPFGLVSGYRTYLVYSYLDGRSDAELSEMGLSRRDIPRAAMESVFEGRNVKA